MAVVEVIPSSTLYTPPAILPDLNPSPWVEQVCGSQTYIAALLVCVWLLVLVFAWATPRVARSLCVLQQQCAARLRRSRPSAQR